MFGLKRDQDFRVTTGDGFSITVRKIDSAGRQANIIEDAAELRRRYDAANPVFRLVCNTRSFFDASAGLGSQMESKLASVNRRKEVLPQTAGQSQACQAKQQEPSG